MNKIVNNIYFRIAIHILVWALLFSLPYIFSSGQNFRRDAFLEHSVIPLGLSAVMFYLNYLLFIDGLFFKRKRLIYFIVNIALIVFFVWIRFEVWEVFSEKIFKDGDMKSPPPLAFRIYFDSISILIPWLIAILIKVFERWLKTEAEKKEVENTRLQSELELLRYQLQPHFFFNSLNNIYALVDISPEKAKVTILALSTLMRYLLYESNTEMVSLDKEADFLLKYTELMQLRISANTAIETDFEITEGSVQIAPLLMIPLIENAFKHGISATAQNRIYISLKCKDDKLYFETRNNNYPKTNTNRSGSGIGLKNIQKRLELLYPESYTFSTQVEGDEFVAKLVLDLK